MKWKATLLWSMLFALGSVPAWIAGILAVVGGKHDPWPRLGMAVGLTIVSPLLLVLFSKLDRIENKIDDLRKVI